MVEDREDYEEVVTIKGSDGTDLVTVKLDANGNIVAVMKGDYAGALQTIKLDSEHRMLARVLPVIEDVILGSDVGYGTISPGVLLFSPAVPAGKRWKITNAVVVNIDGESYRERLYILRGADYYLIANRFDLPMQIGLEWHGEIWLDAGDKLAFQWLAVGIGDECYAYWNGAEYTAEY